MSRKFHVNKVIFLSFTNTVNVAQAVMSRTMFMHGLVFDIIMGGTKHSVTVVYDKKATLNYTSHSTCRQCYSNFSYYCWN